MDNCETPRMPLSNLRELVNQVGLKHGSHRGNGDFEVASDPIGIRHALAHPFVDGVPFDEFRGALPRESADYVVETVAVGSVLDHQVQGDQLIEKLAQT